MSMEDQKFNWETSPLKEAYALLEATTPFELSKRYTQEDQILMRSHLWDYNNASLVTNRVKGILEGLGLHALVGEEKEWAQEILWFWYHHAISCAIGKYKDKEVAQEYAKRAVEYQSTQHPNKITQLLFFLVHDQVDEAREWVSTIEQEPEKTTARQLLEEFEQKGFF